jgi:ribonuclease HI
MNVFFDGSSKGNPGQGASGWIIHNWSQKHKTACGWEFHQKCTNNESEYKALLLALRFIVCRLDTDGPQGMARNVRIFGDSQLVVRQINKVYKVRKPNLTSLYNEAKALIDRIVSSGIAVTVRHVARDLNVLADHLSNVPFQAGVANAMAKAERGGVCTKICEKNVVTVSDLENMLK